MYCQKVTTHAHLSLFLPGTLYSSFATGWFLFKFASLLSVDETNEFIESPLVNHFLAGRGQHLNLFSLLRLSLGFVL